MENSRMKELVEKLVGWVDSHVDEIEKVHILKDHIGMTDEEIQEFGY